MKPLELSGDAVGKGNLILVNPSHPIQNEVARERLVSVTHGVTQTPIFLEKQSARMLSEIISILNSADRITPVSGFRSLSEQTEIYNTSLSENGETFTKKYVAIPGCSEHQTGLAIDLAENSGRIDFICPDFPYTGICGEFRKLALRYGFIERYPKGREEITKISHEPWHFRYVGYPHSVIMKENDLTLEEYTDFLKGFPEDGKHLYFSYENNQFEIYYLPVAAEDRILTVVPDGIPYQVSGNNEDGIVMTLWRAQ
ncbi:M15 family metallopeptidase [Anoxybacterium hadale]|uniref:M15 family metallopeptidase n=2 Tax=Anoxybacterium hadale TaxID=3408580 RepID=A0ACD1AH23_9FIRM|nr:M15 family metallopeptidase [Clostridiales bacterium]